MNNNKRFWGMRISAIITALMLVMCAALSSMAIAAGLTETATLVDDQIDYQSESQTENIAPETLAVSKDQAVALAQYDLGADADWTVTSADLDDDNGVIYYTVVLTDAIGDAHVRLVDAETGVVSVGSLADNKDGDNEDENDSEDDNGDNQNEDQSGEQDEQGDGATGETFTVHTLTPASSGMTTGQALDLVMQALGADARWIIVVSGSVQTNSGLCYQISATSPKGYLQVYLVNTETGNISLTLDN